jgi:hypothetical protein
MQPDELREEVRRLLDLVDAGHAVGIARVVLDRLKGLREAIGPAISARLSGTVHEGLSQEVLISSYRSGIVLKFVDGVLADVSSVAWPRTQDAAARFPDLVFYQMLFGRKSFAELHDMHADCAARSDADADLMDVLFPKKPSDLTFALQ